MATSSQVCTEFTESEWAVVQNYNKASQYLEWISRYISCTDVVASGHREPNGIAYVVDIRYVTFTDDKGVTWTLGHSVGLPIERNGTIEYAPPHEAHAARNPILLNTLEANLSNDYTNCATGVYDSETWKSQYWSICSVQGLELPVTQVQRRCCTCGSGSTNVLMDNFVFAVNDQWFNDTLAQYVETGAFAARLLPSNGATPNTIAPQWILTLKGCTTNPTKPEVRRKMDVYLKSIKEFLTESKQKYKNFDETQVVKIIAAYNGSEFGIKMEDCNGTIATVVVTREICPKAGEELSTYCVEFDRWKSYTDGNCGVYRQLVKANSEDCGYVPCEPAGRKIGTYCEGFDQWAFFTDGNCGKTPVKLHENSEDCGYIPCDKRGTVTGTKCKGFDLYDIVADGDCGTEDVLNTPNSPDCGYVSCDPAGIEKRRYCEGTTQYGEYTDGKCGVTRQLIMANSPDCGYVPPACPANGTLQRTYCAGTTKMGVYHNGTCGTYESVIENNSAECGYTPPKPDPTSRLVDSWWHIGNSSTGIQTVPFEFPNASVMGTATITFDPDGTTWIKPVSNVGLPGGGGNIIIRQSFYLCSQTLGVWEGASDQIETDVSKGYAFPNGAISQAMKTAPDLFAVRFYTWLERGS